MDTLRKIKHNDKKLNKMYDLGNKFHTITPSSSDEEMKTKHNKESLSDEEIWTDSNDESYSTSEDSVEISPVRKRNKKHNAKNKPKKKEKEFWENGF